MTFNNFRKKSLAENSHRRSTIATRNKTDTNLEDDNVNTKL